ncbi:GMC oxidoreductase [Frankia sp. Cj3]|uniref:GMC oxidoreductase n=1 Tax=Frankia sp. Cj3 TaxID=2880976 RepID=UPI001EF56097|nr:GMC oxidoreductase [Frankia sp. Cj3]
MTVIDRRRLLGLAVGGGVTAATTAVIGNPSAFADSNVSGRRAIVIGSGFSGSVAALRLGQAGIRTLVLERGQRYRYSPTEAVFSTELNPSSSMFWFQDTMIWPGVPETPIDRVPGLMQIVVANGIEMACAAAVGGGSVVYAGCTVQPPRKYFEALFPAGVSYSELDRVYYPRVRRMLNTQTVPDDIYRSDPFTHARAYDDQMRAAGFPTTPVMTDFNWDKVRGELAGKLRPSATVGESSFGNSDGAKNDTTQNYLPAAVSTGNVQINPLTEVTGIRSCKGGGYAVEVRQLATDGSVVSTRELTTDLLFLAAGSINTTRLLVAARETGALPNLSAAIGSNWGTNGDAFTFRGFSGPTGATQAAPCVSTTFLDGNFGIPVRVENWWLINFNGTPNLAQFSVAVDMDNRGTWTYDRATAQVNLADWDASKNVPAEAAPIAFNQMLVDKGIAGQGPPAPTGITAHPLGGCELGKATDLYGRVKGYKGLYAIDASVIPGNVGGANPSFTIAALAERALDNIIAAGF